MFPYVYYKPKPGVSEPKIGYVIPFWNGEHFYSVARIFGHWYLRLFVYPYGS